MSKKAEQILEKKALQSQICYESLKSVVDVNDNIPVVFCVDGSRKSKMIKACFKNNSFPKYKPVLDIIRLRGVRKLFQDEKILQTPPTAAALAACGSIASEIGQMRGGCDIKPKVYCDIAFAGMQAIRLYMEATIEEAFSFQRYKSCFNVNNGFNGSFYKYPTKDNRYVSIHVYYESQKAKLIKALKMDKDSKEFTMQTNKQDRKAIAEKVASFNGTELEEFCFDCGASGCMLRSRKEWEQTEVGKAVCEMPLLRTTKVNDSEPKKYPKTTKIGPLSGIKVLDLTHIIAGPACTRILAEYGADVLLVRRGDFHNQEQSFLELDGWAGKHSIQLDFNDEKALKRVKELIKEADVVAYSYQNGVLDHFGLSVEDMYKLNPNLIYGNLMCFSDSVWKDRPGWAPLAEDITGLSIRNGSVEKPKNLNGVPLDYIPGTVLAMGILNAIKKSMVEGGSYHVTTSLTRAAQWLHECTDLCQNNKDEKFTTTIEKNKDFDVWKDVIQFVDNNAVGKVGFPSPAIVNPNQPDTISNMRFTDGNTNWKQEK